MEHYKNWDEENSFEETAYDILVTNSKVGKNLTIPFSKEDFLDIIEEKQSLLLYETLIWVDAETSILVPYSDILIEN